MLRLRQYGGSPSSPVRMAGGFVIATHRFVYLAIALTALPMVACSTRPSEGGLRDSFSAQLAANPAVKDFARQGDDLSFAGPSIGGADTARWRVHIDSAVIETTNDARQPYKGTVKSSWFRNEQLIRPSADGRMSNLPGALTSRGLAQDCWAQWDPEARTWGWE